MIPAVGRYRSASGPKQIILTSGTSWTVPSDWNSANNTVECIGAGYRGGGAYAKKSNLALTAGAGVAYQIGTYSATQSVANTWFGAGAAVLAQGSIGNAGGSAASSVGDVTYSGGTRSGGTGGGGGGAGMQGAGLANSGSTGGAGNAGYGGAGGASSNPGSPGTEWGTAGSGGGGGGSGAGGGGGNYGGGGAGSAAGAPGVIVITYTP